MLHTHLANRPAALAAALGALLRIDPLPLLETETVVVPSGALARWLGFRLADSLGIGTQNRFVFPAAYVWQLIGSVLPDIAAQSPFDRESMRWRLLRLLGEQTAPELRHYLRDDDGARQFQLAGELAGLFDRYLVERPDWMTSWSVGRPLGLGADENWQMVLWRCLLAELPPSAQEHPRARFLAALTRDAALRARLPRRIALFCVEAMPDQYWEVFVRLAHWIDVHVFVLAPCREYWGDIEKTRIRLRLEIEQPDAAILCEIGHPLLASLGRARQHAGVRLVDAAQQAPSAEHAYFAPPPATLLGRLQGDLLDLQASAGLAPDASLQIHACHGPQREAEVLLDRLLECFERLPDLHPDEILILTPDIETYAPVVAAVLGHAPRERRIPCAVADRPLFDQPVWRALRRLCDTAAGEFEAESLLSLLDEPELRRAWEIAEDELPVLREWVRAAGIRWGMDAAFRAKRGLPAEAAHSWRAGLERLLLGAALPDRPERFWRDILPAVGIEGQATDLLGRLVDFVEALSDLHEKLGAGLTAHQWSRLLLATLERFFAPETAAADPAQDLRETLLALGEAAREARCEVRLPLSALLRDLDSRLAARASARAFATGAATLAALQPGRPLPARVVCLVGMNDGAWPRPLASTSFDLLAAQPRPGDRLARAEERYAFLEALLCAGDAAIITYTGRDARSNLEQPPAAPLAELIDTMSAMTGRPAAEIVLRHPLQPFGREYFSAADARLFSYDSEHCPPSGVSPNAHGRWSTADDGICPPCVFHAKPVSFFDIRLPIHDEPREISPSDLRRFFAQPVRYFLREQLGIRLADAEEPIAAHEPFVPDRREAYRLREAQFAGLCAGESADETEARLRGRGCLPQGVAGQLAAAAARAQTLPLWESAQPWRAAAALPECQVDFPAAGLRIVGSLEGLCARGLWRVRHGAVRARDRLDLWLDHLLLNVAKPSGADLNSTLIARDGPIELAPEPNAAALLADLLDLYREGMRRALPFYPETAWAWLSSGNSRRAWLGDSYTGTPGEGDDAYLRVAWRDSCADPLGAEFEDLARRIFGPMQARLKHD